MHIAQSTEWLPSTATQWNWFVRRQALSCAFPLYIFLMLALTQAIHIPHVPRYDLLLILCLAAQAVFLWTRYETFREFQVIMAFHAIGLLLEIYKTHYHAWSYPGPSTFHIAGVPLYSGFMYASVASYICQAWRRLNLRLVNVPNCTVSSLLAVAIYINFFTERIFPDLRWPLIALVFLHARRTFVEYGPAPSTTPSPFQGEGRCEGPNSAFCIHNSAFSRMPLAVSLVLIGLFVWLAENFGTLCGAWRYPDQHHAWQLVHASKMSSWFMLVVIEFLIVARLKCRPQTNADRPRTRSPRRRTLRPSSRDFSRRDIVDVRTPINQAPPPIPMGGGRGGGLADKKAPSTSSSRGPAPHTTSRSAASVDTSAPVSTVGPPEPPAPAPAPPHASAPARRVEADRSRAASPAASE